MKKPLIAVLMVFFLVVAGLVGWRASSEKGGNRLVLYGNVDIRQISLSFDNSGRITEVLADEGDSIKAGQVLARLDVRILQLQANEVRADIDAQQQTVLKLHNGSRPQEIAQERARLAAAQADATRAERDLARLQEVAANTQGRGVSQQDLDNAKNNATSTKAKLDEQREALRLAELGPRVEEIAGAEAQLKATQAKLALLQYQISQGALKAPADAVVRSRLLEPGDMASSVRPVFAMALTEPKWVRVYVSETDLGKVKPGMTARVFTDSYPDRPINASIGYISSVAEFTPKSVQTEELRTSLVYEVRLKVKDDGNLLRLGQPVTVRLMVDSAQ
jgi:HlyD family secretion protein